MHKEKCWWTVVTDCGTRRTLAVSRAKAIRNARWRLVMDDRPYRNARPRDFAEMRDIVVIEVRRDEDTKDGASPLLGHPLRGQPAAGGYGGPEPCPGRV